MAHLTKKAKITREARADNLFRMAKMATWPESPKWLKWPKVPEWPNGRKRSK